MICCKLILNISQAVKCPNWLGLPANLHLKVIVNLGTLPNFIKSWNDALRSCQVQLSLPQGHKNKPLLKEDSLATSIKLLKPNAEQTRKKKKQATQKL